MAYKAYTLLLFPLFSIIALVVTVYLDYLILSNAIIVFVITFLAYLLIVSIILGCFHHPYPKVAQRGPFVYYFKAYQEPYWSAAKKFTSLFSSSEHVVLERNSEFLGWYWDNPRALENPNLCRSILGCVILKEKREIIEIMEKTGLIRVELPQWKAVEASMRVITEVSYGVAPMKLIGPICEYVERNFPEKYEPTPMYELCNGKYTTYGYVISDNQIFFRGLKPYPDPKLTAEGELEIMKMSSKKQQ